MSQLTSCEGSSVASGESLLLLAPMLSSGNGVSSFHSLLDSRGPQMDLAHQKFLERVTADGLVVSVVVTSFNPRDHPGRQELGLLHFADVETGGRWGGLAPGWEIRPASPVPLTVIPSIGVGVTTCLTPTALEREDQGQDLRLE